MAWHGFEHVQIKFKTVINLRPSVTMWNFLFVKMSIMKRDKKILEQRTTSDSTINKQTQETCHWWCNNKLTEAANFNFVEWVLCPYMNFIASEKIGYDYWIMWMSANNKQMHRWQFESKGLWIVVVSQQPKSSHVPNFLVMISILQRTKDWILNQFS